MGKTAFLLPLLAALALLACAGCDGHHDAGRTPPGRIEDLSHGRPYRLSQAPTYALCTDPGDAVQLTDGRRADAGFWTDPGCVGWTNAKRVEIAIDLGREALIDEVEISVAGGEGARSKGVFLPDAWILVGDSAGDFRHVGSHWGLEGHYLAQERLSRAVYRTGGIGVRGRTVLVVLWQNGDFIFTDEITVRGSPDGSAASASSHPRMPVEDIERRYFPERARSTAAIEQALRSRELSAAVRQSAGEGGPQRTGGEPDDDAALRRRFAANLRAAGVGGPLVAWNRDVWSDYREQSIPDPAGMPVRGLRAVLGIDEREVVGVALTNATDRPMSVTAGLSGGFDPSGGGWPVGPALRGDAFSRCLDGVRYPDAWPLLVDGLVEIPPGSTRQVMVVIDAAGQRPGRFAGSLELVADSHGVRLSIPVEAEVLPAVLPRRPTLDLAVYGYLDLPLVQAAPEAALADQAAHRVTHGVLGVPQLPRYVLSDRFEIVSADYTAFDAAVSAHRRQGIERFLFFSYVADLRRGIHSPLGGNVVAPTIPKIGTEAWRTAMQAVIRAWVDHCEAIGLAPGQYRFYPIDEPGDALIAAARPVWEAIAAADPRASCFVTVPHASVRAMSGLSGLVRTWTPGIGVGNSAPVIDAERSGFFARERERGAGLWLYNCDGPDKRFPALLHYRQMAWKAWAMGAEGVGVWCYADTGRHPGATAWSDLDGQRSDYALVYDRAGAPSGVRISDREPLVPSRRWEALRDGVEDHAWLVALDGLAARQDGFGEPARHLIAEIRDRVLAQSMTAADLGSYRHRMLRLVAASRPAGPVLLNKID